MTVRIGIIGSGGMGRTWAEAAARYAPDCRLTAIAGGSRASALAASRGVAAEPSVEALLARPDVDAVVIATPQPTHCEYVLAAAAAGKHILCEKPMAMTIGEADRMVEAAERAGIVLGIVSQHRFRRTPTAAKRLVDGGRIGDVRMAQVRGVLPPWAVPTANVPWADLGMHLCDILRWLVGSDAEAVSAQFASYSDAQPPEQSAFVTFRFRSGVLAHVWFTYEIPRPGLGSNMQFLITGSEAMIDLDSYSTVRLSHPDGWEVIETQPPDDPTDELDPVRMEPYGRQMADFVEAVRTGREPRISGRDGRQTMAMVDGAIRSAAAGGTLVTLD